MMTPKQELMLRTENAVLKMMLAGEEPSIALVLDDTARKISGEALSGYIAAGQSEIAAMVQLIGIGIGIGISCASFE